MRKRRTRYQQKQKMDYDDYVKEREQLSNGEQSKYDSYEKAILTLSASFLAFSVGFVGLFKQKTQSGVEAVTVVAPGLLTWTWVFFASSVFLMLLNFIVTAQAFRKETVILGKALEDISALKGKNTWSGLGYLLYLSSGASFVSGIGFLVVFCAKNLHTL
jgi:hypothetical protein